MTDQSNQLDYLQAGLNQERERFEEEKDQFNQERHTVNQAEEQQEQLSSNLERRQALVQRIEEIVHPLAQDIRSPHAHTYQAYNFLTAVIQRLDKIEE